eukprot:CAMPEP_0198112156 /NCGR_PEP_ID=MMETSP1442-20131203/4054_1 /TAXON_ID= /ORGANISM="Craspedostauros australis, Strain CCMP3328" /LENGTH=95 /DNA_ID=CAMNT_0043768843 /DNA_START=851 /DNA_END=1135 /DNA_ORIENTATION=-
METETKAERAGRGDTKQDEVEWKVPVFGLGCNTPTLEVSGRPDNLPDGVDAFLWGKLSYHVTLALKTHCAAVDSLNRRLLGIGALQFLSILALAL